jgi:hypothetical protein
MSSASAHPWSTNALFAKSLLFIRRMEASSPNDSQFGIWSSLALELLARAALSNVSPTLLAENDNWRHITYAMGREATVKKYIPFSIGTKDVLNRLSELVPTFTRENADFCAEHIGRRNAELHTGELIFDFLGTSQWLPRFYAASRVLLESIGKTLSDYISDAKGAESMIASLSDAAAQAVSQDIKAYAQVWSKKLEADRETATTQALAWATRQSGHRVKCPACESTALLQGEPIGTVTTELDGDEVVQVQNMLPSAFECVACGLRILGLSKLSSAGVGDVFTAKSIFAAAEYFNLFTKDDVAEARAQGPEYEDDNNE